MSTNNSSKKYSDELPSINSLKKIHDLKHKKPILIIGDCILDCYIKGVTDRLSREAPIPILDYNSENFLPGGAANTACNIASMGCPAILLGVIGDDKSGEKLKDALSLYPLLSHKLIINPETNTIVKTRFISRSQQMFRFDKNNIDGAIEKSEPEILSTIESLLPKIGAVILSDYDNGVLTEKILQFTFKSAKKRGLLTVVDPRAFDMKRYEGADFITPNLEELNNSYHKPIICDKDVVTASKELISKYSFQGVLATKGSQGLTLVRKNDVVNFPAKARKVFDVTGAGDCVISWFTLAYYAGFSCQTSALLANSAGGLAVEVVGVAVLTVNDLRKAIQNPDFGHSYKIHNTDTLVKQIKLWKQKKYRIGFTNGCFDIFHAGHVFQINYAKSNCDKLILALNSDKSVSKLKGANRPLQNQLHRCQMIASLADVDAVIVFNETDACKIISKVKPDFYVKGADYNLDTLEEAVLVRSLGGTCLSAPILENLSSTSIIKKIILNHI